MAEALEYTIQFRMANTDLEDTAGVGITDLAANQITLTGGGWVDVTTDVHFPIKIDVGIRGGGLTDRVARPGTMSFNLENSALNENGLLGYWTPGHTNAPADWQERMEIRFGWRESGGTKWYWRFHGKINSITPLPGSLGKRTVAVLAKDYAHNLQAFTKANTLTLTLNTTTDVGYQLIIDALTDKPRGTNFAAGRSVLPAIFHKQSGRPSAFSEILKLAQSDFEYVWIDGDGFMRSQNRTDRLEDTSVQFTLNGEMLDVSIAHSSEDIPDKFVFDVFPVNADSELSNVASVSSPQRILVGETVTFELKYSDAIGGNAIGALDVETAPTDFTFSNNPDSETAVLNDNLSLSVAPASTTCEVTATNNGNSIGYLNTLNIQGKAVRSYDKITKEVVVGSGDTDKVINIALHYQQSGDVAQAAATMAASVYSQIWPTNVTVLAGTDAAMITDVLTLGLIGNRIKLIEGVTNINHEMFINGISIIIKNFEDVEVNYVLAPAQTAGVFTIGVSTLGGSDQILFSGG